MKHGLLLLLVLAGCDQVFNLSRVDISTLPFDPPVALASINTTSEEDRPTLTDDGLEIYFHHERAIWTARRARADAPFEPPAVVEELRGGFETIRACVSGDGLRMYLSRRERSAGDPAVMHVAVRASRDVAWSPPTAIAELVTSFPDDDVFCGWEDAAGTSMLISFGTGAMVDIARISRPMPGGAFVDVAPLPDFNTALREGAPWANADASIVVFDRREGTKIDVYQATLQGTTYAVRQLNELDIVGSGSPWLSKDGRTIVFVHDNDLWTANR